jgi:hypothetical protein
MHTHCLAAINLKTDFKQMAKKSDNRRTFRKTTLEKPDQDAVLLPKCKLRVALHFTQLDLILK